MKRRGATTEALTFVIVIGFVCLTVFVIGIFPHIDKGNLSASDLANIGSAIATISTSLATILIAYFAMKSNEQARESADKTNQIAENIERERTRPRVVSEFIYKDKNICVEVRNDGFGLAKDIEVELPYQVVSITGFGAKFPLNYPITLLPPSRKKIAILMDREEFFKAHKKLEFKIEVSYKDTMDRKYKDSFFYDLTPDMYLGLSDG